MLLQSPFDDTFSDPTGLAPQRYLDELREWSVALSVELQYEPPSTDEEHGLIEHGFRNTTLSLRHGSQRVGCWLLDVTIMARLVERLENDFRAHLFKNKPANFFVRLAASKPVRLTTGQGISIAWLLRHPLPLAAGENVNDRTCYVSMPMPDRLQIRGVPGPITLRMADRLITFTIPDAGILDITSVDDKPVREFLETVREMNLLNEGRETHD